MAVRLTPSMAQTIASLRTNASRVTPYRRSANLVYKRKKRYNRKAKAVVAKPFRQAYNKLQPSKEKRFSFEDLAMATNGTLAQRTEYLALDTITQDSDANSRLGSQVHISYLHFKGTLSSNDLNKTKGFRIMVFREVNNGGFDPATMNYLFKGVGTTTYAPIGTQQDLKWPLNREMVQPIFDKRIYITPESYGLKLFNYKIRINKLVNYQPMNTASSTPYHGRLFLVVCLADCDNVPSGTTVCLSAGTRTFFKDGRKSR